MQRHYYAIVAERCGIRVAMRLECDVAEVGDLVSGSNKATVYSGYKVITEPHFVLCGTSEDDFLNAMYAGDIPQVSKVTRDVWKLEPEKEDASDVDIGSGMGRGVLRCRAGQADRPAPRVRLLRGAYPRGLCIALQGFLALWRVRQQQ